MNDVLMKIKVIETIWIVEDHDTGELICATKTFEDAIDYLYRGNWLYEDTKIKTDDFKWKPIKEVFGERWLEIVKRFSSSKIDRLFEWDISIRQLDLVEVIR